MLAYCIEVDHVTVTVVHGSMKGIGTEVGTAFTMAYYSIL